VQDILHDTSMSFSCSWSYGVLLWEIVTLGKCSNHSRYDLFK